MNDRAPAGERGADDEPETRPARRQDEPRARRLKEEWPGGPWDQGSSAFFCEIRRRTRSASRAPSNGFLNASLNPSEYSSSLGSSLVRATRIVDWWSWLLRRFC